MAFSAMSGTDLNIVNISEAPVPKIATPIKSQGTSGGLPRIALVTPVYNSGKYIEQSIRSVLAQDYPNLDYFIVDGGSTDNTIDIIRKYEGQISGWISESDNGMYDAINKGFARTTGDIMGWISATDMLQLGGLFVAATIFRDLPQVEWVTGRRTVFNDVGMTLRVDPPFRWSRYRFIINASWRHIQQESTFWRRGLWDRAGKCVDGSRRIAGDFELWVRFFRHAQLYTANTIIGGFREHFDSISLLDLTTYNEACDQIARGELTRTFGSWFKSYWCANVALGRIPKIGGAWNRLKAMGLRGMDVLPGWDLAPLIEYHKGRWSFR